MRAAIIIGIAAIGLTGCIGYSVGGNGSLAPIEDALATYAPTPVSYSQPMNAEEQAQHDAACLLSLAAGFNHCGLPGGQGGGAGGQEPPAVGEAITLPDGSIVCNTTCPEGTP